MKSQHCLWSKPWHNCSAKCPLLIIKVPSVIYLSQGLHLLVGLPRGESIRNQWGNCFSPFPFAFVCFQPCATDKMMTQADKLSMRQSSSVHRTCTPCLSFPFLINTDCASTGSSHLLHCCLPCCIYAFSLRDSIGNVAWHSTLSHVKYHSCP